MYSTRFDADEGLIFLPSSSSCFYKLRSTVVGLSGFRDRVVVFCSSRPARSNIVLK
jgi:hypothetical protein